MPAQGKTSTEDRISPRFGREKLGEKVTIEDKIDVYEDRLQGWIFDHAHWLISDAYPLHVQSAIAVLLLTNAYFEQFWSFKTGQESRGKERQFFDHGFDNVFRQIDVAHRDHLRQIFYQQIRCKLAHEWLPGSKVIIVADLPAAVGYTFNQNLKIGSIAINPTLYVQGFMNISALTLISSEMVRRRNSDATLNPFSIN